MTEEGSDRNVRPAPALNIQVLYIQRVFFDELPAGFDVFAHQRGEDGLALGYVLKLYREQSSPLGIHCRLPMLRRSHFAQTFVTFNVVAFAAFGLHIVE